MWLLTGLWHGASWNFVLWGLWYGLWLIVERLPAVHRLLKKIPGVIRWIFTMIIVLLGWVLFLNMKPDVTLLYLRGMIIPAEVTTLSVSSFLSVKLIIVLAACVLCASPLAKKLLEKAEESRRLSTVVVRSVLALAVLALCVVLLMSDTYNPFIYFRF